LKSPGKKLYLQTNRLVLTSCEVVLAISVPLMMKIRNQLTTEAIQILILIKGCKKDKGGKFDILHLTCGGWM